MNKKPGENHLAIIVVAVAIAALSKVAEEVVHYAADKIYKAQDSKQKAAKTQKKSKKKVARRRPVQSP